MANPKLPDISDQEQLTLYEKLNLYNQKKASYKEVGCYIIVPPQGNRKNYTLWIYTPLLEKHCILFIEELYPSIYSSLRKVTKDLWYANRCIIIADYNEKRMTSHGEDLISFGKYRGHFLYEIERIDPGYIDWIAHKYIPRIPKQECFLKMAQAYNEVYADKTVRRRKQNLFSKQKKFAGRKGDKIEHLTVKILNVKIEDNPYKTRIIGTSAIFYVQQRISAIDNSGNHFNFTISSKQPSRASCQVPSLEHSFQTGEIIQLTSARIAATFVTHNIFITRLNYVRIKLIGP